MIRVEGLQKTHAGHEVPTLKGVSFTLEDGTLAAVLGPSGSGKTTLLRCIAGLEKWDEGKIDLGGKPGLVFQSFELFPHLSALQNCTLAPRQVNGVSKEQAEQSARTLLRELGLQAHAEKYPDTLSGGQKQRVAIARALAMKPSVLLYDEPTSALDPALRGEVVETLKRVKALGVTQLVVTHEVRLARACDRVLLMADGKVAAFGAPAEVLTASDA